MRSILMKFSWISDKILSEISSILDQVDDESVQNLVETLIKADRIFVSGLGRSGLVARSFAMRLMHLGLKVLVVGDITTPAISKGDLLIVISGSGETPIIKHVIERSKESGATIFLITSKADANTISLSDQVIILPNVSEPILPLRSAFEASAYILLDSAVIMIMDKKNITQQDMMTRHSNLE
ncbi:TPA: SIS domain-containing protein [bacterium]|nr:SIS domain-containing protein [bacterium]